MMTRGRTLASALAAAFRVLRAPECVPRRPPGCVPPSPRGRDGEPPRCRTSRLPVGVSLEQASSAVSRVSTAASIPARLTAVILVRVVELREYSVVELRRYGVVKVLGY